MGEEETEEEDDFDGDDEEDSDEAEEGKKLNIFNTPELDRAAKNPELILKDKDMKNNLESTRKLREALNKKNDEKMNVHPGFVASYSFGEQEYERLKFILFRLDEIAEKVMTYRKEYLDYFPEFFAVLKNLYYCIYFIIDSYSKQKIQDGFDYVEQAVIAYTTKKEMNYFAITMLSEIYLLLSNIKNFHGLGFSYEKKKGESERFGEALFKKRRPR